MDATPAPRVTLEITSRSQHVRLPLVPAPPAPPMAGQLPTGVAGGTTTAYTTIESDCLLGSCGLTEEEWDPDLLRLYNRMLEEGRTSNNCERFCRP
jgi:hypothetical protein